MANKRKKFSAEEKVKILRLHLIEKEPVSDVCDKHGLNPNVFYRWQKQFFENGTAAFEKGRDNLKDKRCRYGKVNEHNAWIPRDFWLADWEKQAIIAYFYDHPLEGYRRPAYMMMDDDIVAVSPSSIYRVLKNAGLMQRWNRKASKKGTGFQQPLKPHEHWHIDISYINVCGTFYYLCSILDGFSRYIVHWEIRESMTEADVEIILQRAREKFPNARPRIISDNGPQFISKDFKEFIRISGMTHVKTSPYYPQSNGKLERYHKTIKGTCIRVQTPLSLEDAIRIVMERSLTIIEQMTTIPLVGETEVSSAEAQLTRDSQPGVTDYRMGGRFQIGHPAHFFATVIQNSLMPKKTSLPKARQSLNSEVDLSNSR